jgi:stress-induced morphogen
MNSAQMTERLKQAYPDGAIEVVDLTGTENHWEVTIATNQFKGMSRIQQHQAIMEVFGPELKTGEVHALSIRTRSL